MVLYVLDKSFNVTGIIDEYESLIWRPAYYDVGDFELYVKASNELINLLKREYYIVRSSDVTVEGGVSVYSKVMIIENFKLTTSLEEGDHYIVTGRELKFLLHKRIVWGQTNLSGTVENGIRRLITENAINPTDTKRKIPDLVLGAAAGFTDTFKKQITGASLDEAVTEICRAYGYGWDIFIYNSQLVFILYQGLDRSYDQTDRPYVIFSDEFDNLLSSEYVLNSESCVTTALVGGEGEGTERVFVSIGTDKSGLERCETLIDARDLSRNKDTEDEIPLEEYEALLAERGKAKLSGLTMTEEFFGEILSDGTFKYGSDFDMGDVVTVINSYGISKNVRVISAIESDDETGTKLIPQFLFQEV